MNEGWLVDGRKIPDEVMGYIRKIAVQAVRRERSKPRGSSEGTEFQSQLPLRLVEEV